MLQVNNLTYRVGGRVLLDRASMTVPKSHRVSLIGPNGAGKSTLLRLIAGEIAVDEGSISMPANWRMATVAQEAPGGAESLIDTVLAADRERAVLLDEAEHATDPHRIAEIQVRLADIGAHGAPARAASILAGLGFDEATQQRPCSALSGGMRMRVALAATLFLEPDLLLLDEPTNHLDLEAGLWLENHLRTYPRTLLLVSHDRDLLNQVPQTTVHLENGKLVTYTGGYDSFERTRRMRLEHQSALNAKQLAQRRHMQAFVDRFRYKASKARQAQSRLKALERMEPIVSVVESRTIAFDFPKPEPLSPPLVSLEAVDTGYDGKPVLSGLDLRIDMDDRIALLGANGNGKSTLVKLLAGRLAPLDGELRKSRKLTVGYFAQHQTDELNPAMTALEQAAAVQPMATMQKLRNHLGRFGFSGPHADTRIGSLSGGEKARLLLALMSHSAPHLLLLDEPTNHLDVDSREALVQAINAYEGAVVLITHDPHLIELTADRLWLVTDGTVTPYDGDLDDYRRLFSGRRQTPREATTNGDNGGTSRKNQRRESAAARAALAHLRKRVDAAEKEIDRLNRRKAALEKDLADPALYDGQTDKLTTLTKSLRAVESALTVAEHAWLEAHEALEGG
ncbi:MAG: ABC-F family ATP-binding cassette domain-containing protein [Inquilinus sp.]|nr:ABC-F family ATP-binding cassette domain-containing protein [Inquilinus sp.]